ncbi:MAG: MBL fold metallo-hydrolase, partial [Bacteroidota bacterium]
VHHFTFNAFQENTYLLNHSITKECIIIDPGCATTAEQQALSSYIDGNALTPIRLINTHCHIDHVLGNAFVADRYGLNLEAHRLEEPVLASCDAVSKAYGIPFAGSPPIHSYLEEGHTVDLGGIPLSILLTPGHSPGSICLHASTQGWLIGGDVLFYNSIGRTDLPGGDHQTLIGSILAKLMPLPETTIVYPGHGPQTTIGQEKNNNPFF